jgi:hypothetical protein
MLAGYPTGSANSQKDSELSERKPEPKSILNQAHSVDDRLTVYAIPGRSACRLRQEADSLVMANRISANARPPRKLSDSKPRLLHEYILWRTKDRLVPEKRLTLDSFQGS